MIRSAKHLWTHLVASDLRPTRRAGLRRDMLHDRLVHRRLDSEVRDKRSNALHAKQTQYLIDLRGGKLIRQRTVVESSQAILVERHAGEELSLRTLRKFAQRRARNGRVRFFVCEAIRLTSFLQRASVH